MSTDSVSLHPLQTVKYGLLLAMLTIALGFGLGGAFGGAEASIKAHLNAKAQASLATVYKGDAAKAKATVSKAFRYLQRSHLHGGGIGAGVLALCLALAFMPGRERLRQLTSIALGIGALGYSMFWLLAGLKAPALGSTHAAKDATEWLAVPSAGLLLLGLLASIVTLVLTTFLPARK